MTLNVNCLNSSGSDDNALHWLTEQLITQLEHQLYKNGVPEWNELRGLYFLEYERRRLGVGAHLYQNDKASFQQQFSEFLDKKVEEDREGYLNRILNDVVCNRKKLPILVLDNTDEFSADFKQAIFQFAQSLRRSVNHCLLIFPITDKSAWSFSKTDIFSIYQSRSFFLPTPPPREVFRKRIDFIREKLKSLPTKSERQKYLSEKGIKISIENLEGFAAIVEDVFVNHEFTSKTIGEISNYNIRNTLALSQRIITSSVYDIVDLLKAFVAGKASELKHSKFMNALLKGDYEQYKFNDNHFIYPIFQVSDKIRQSPLIALRILSLLEAARNSARTLEDRHVKIESIYAYFEALGLTEQALDEALRGLLEASLIEGYDPSVKDLATRVKTQ